MRLHRHVPALFDKSLLAVVSAVLGAVCPCVSAAADLAAELKTVPHRIVYETWQEGNWELLAINADGSGRTNLTRTPAVHELYPHVSPDGTKVLFEVDEGEGDATVRSVWFMNMDGTGRTLVAKYARDACWKGDGTAIAYLPDEFQKFNYIDYATKGLVIYDLKTKERRPHPNKGLHHLYNVCWSPDGQWFVSTVHAGMGFSHAILAFRADDASRVFNLDIPGCRPDLSPDGKRLCWGASDFAICVADIDLSGPEPKLSNRRDVATSVKPVKIYHSDWSPDGRFIAFATGPTEKKLGRICEVVGVKAPGWNIGVADAVGKLGQVIITSDGASDKEPDWAPAAR